MARAHRVGSVAALIVAVYFLILFNVIPLPFFEAETSNQIVPLVRFYYPVWFFDSSFRIDLEPLLNRSCKLPLHIWRFKLPWWLLVSFGAYSLWSLGWGLLQLRECPEAYEELITVSFCIISRSWHPCIMALFSPGAVIHSVNVMFLISPDSLSLGNRRSKKRAENERSNRRLGLCHEFSQPSPLYSFLLGDYWVWPISSSVGWRCWFQELKRWSNISDAVLI